MKREKEKDIIHQISHVLIAVFMIAQIGAFIFYYNYGTIFSLKVIGNVFWAISAIFGWVPIYTFKKRGGVPKGKSFVKTTKFVDTGIFSIVRHPQYLAGMLWSIAFMLISQHWLVVVLGIPPVVLFYLGGIDGDRACVEKFGKKYEDYMERVPRFNLILGTIKKLKE